MEYIVLVTVGLNGYMEIEAESKEDAEKKAAEEFKIQYLSINSVEAVAMNKKESEDK